MAGDDVVESSAPLPPAGPATNPSREPVSVILSRLRAWLDGPARPLLVVVIYFVALVVFYRHLRLGDLSSEYAGTTVLLRNHLAGLVPCATTEVALICAALWTIYVCAVGTIASPEFNPMPSRRIWVGVARAILLGGGVLLFRNPE